MAWKPAPADPGEAPLPYARHRVTPEDFTAVERVLGSPRLAQGPEAQRFEADLSAATGTTRALALSSGTAALHVALQALGVGPGDEVIVPSLTFVATANAVVLCGAEPRFADVDPETLCLDPESVARLTGARTRGAIPMHYGGHPADVEGVACALGPGRFVLEDACHGLGAALRGRPVGSLGDAACFSFHPAKAITTGEGGALVCSDSELAETARAFREHGIERASSRFEGLGLPPHHAAEERGAWVYELPRVGSNYRLAEPAAALGRSQLARLDESIEARRKRADAYTHALKHDAALRLPQEQAEFRSAWHLYALRIDPDAIEGGRAALHHAMQCRGIGVQVHYIPVHLQPYYRRRSGSAWGDLPNTEDAYLRLLSLPLFPDLSDAEQGRVLESLCEEMEALRR